MSELPEGIPPGRVPEPRDSASGIVVRRAAGGRLELLLGLRSRRSRFLPGQLAFPGGGLEPVDRPGAPRAFARCVARELGEETGLTVPVELWRDAGERITPPLFPIRFRTRFFVAPFPGGVAEPTPATAENERLRMVEAQTVLEEWERGETRVPPPVLPILRCLADSSSASLEAIADRIAQANAVEQTVPRIEFAPEVWMLPVKTATLPPATHTNVWMPGGRRFVLIDPGSDELEEQERLLAVVRRRMELGHEPLAVLLTHHHRDHVRGAGAIAAALGLPVRAHRSVLRSIALEGAGVATHPVEDGEQIDLAGMRLRALLTPGHAPGHLAFHLVDRDMLIGGDLTSGVSTILIHPESGDMEAYVASLERARDLRCRTVLPGHGPPLPGRALDRLLEHRREREQRLLAGISRTPVTLSELAGRAYADTPQAPPALTELQTRSQLIWLEKRGLVRRSHEGWMRGREDTP